MSDDFDIEISAEPIKSLSVHLVGKTYNIRVPKTTLLLQMGMAAKVFDKKPEKLIEVTDKFIDGSLSKSDAKEIHARLEAGDDPLELMHLVGLAAKMFQKVTGNPTT